MVLHCLYRHALLLLAVLVCDLILIVFPLEQKVRFCNRNDSRHSNRTGFFNSYHRNTNYSISIKQVYKYGVHLLFSTVWYELLAGSWPLQGSSSESIIWQVGSDNRRNINQVQSAKDVKVRSCLL